MAPLTNTLENARNLEEAGLPSRQADAIAQGIESALSAAQQDLKGFIKEQNQAMEERFGERMASMEERFGERMASMEERLLAHMDAKIANALRAQTFSILALMCALVGGVVAVFKLFP